MKALSIYADLPPTHRAGPRLTLVPASPSFAFRPAKPGEPTVSADAERAIIEVLDAPPGAGETIEAAFRRKENELGEVFARLTVLESRVLHKRLTAPNDPLAIRFGRLVAARRDRLLAFLADARRREATAIGKGGRR